MQMKLYCNHRSPYAAKVRAVAWECGLTDRIELVLAEPTSPDDPVHRINPLGRIPALVNEEGLLLVDSPVICEYLDSLSHPHAGLIPPHGPARWKALRRQALGDGLMDTAVPWRIELMRPESQRSAEWLDRRKHQVVSTLAYLETLGSELEIVDVGNLSVACAIGYLEFRFPQEDFPSRFVDLFEWFGRFSQRESLVHCLPR